MINGHRQGDCERFALVALFKRATVSDSDPSLLTKEQPWQIARFLWAKSNMSDFLVNQAARSQNRAIRDSIWQFFNDFPLFYAQERIAPVTLHSVALFFGAIRSRRSLQNYNCERFAHVAHDKRAMGAIRSFSRPNHSLAHKKWVIHLKNQWSNSQPWAQAIVLTSGWVSTEVLKGNLGIFLFSSHVLLFTPLNQ